jgi:hypothetical protein
MGRKKFTTAQQRRHLLHVRKPSCVLKRDLIRARHMDPQASSTCDRPLGSLAGRSDGPPGVSFASGKLDFDYMDHRHFFRNFEILQLAKTFLKIRIT